MNTWFSARIIFIKASLCLNDLLLYQTMWSPVQQSGIASLSIWICCSVCLCKKAHLQVMTCFSELVSEHKNEGIHVPDCKYAAVWMVLAL